MAVRLDLIISKLAQISFDLFATLALFITLLSHQHLLLLSLTAIYIALLIIDIAFCANTWVKIAGIKEEIFCSSACMFFQLIIVALIVIHINNTRSDNHLVLYGILVLSLLSIVCYSYVLFLLYYWTYCTKKITIKCTPLKRGNGGNGRRVGTTNAPINFKYTALPSGSQTTPKTPAPPKLYVGADFKHMGPLVIPRNMKIEMNPKIDADAERDDNPPDAHIRFTEHDNIVYDIGSDVEKVVDN